MKVFRFMFVFTLLLTATAVFGQKEQTISSMKEGTVLTAADIGFLSMVSKADLESSRGSAVREATVNKVTYKAGQTLSNADAKAITTAIMDFQKNYRAPDGSRGAGWCYYWYYYCDYWGYCYWYKYWYYC
jgi:hypothetical protein